MSRPWPSVRGSVRIGCLLVGATILSQACDGGDPVERDGGTFPATGIAAPLAEIVPDESSHAAEFEAGFGLAHRTWTPSDGLGLAYSADSCVSCHNHPRPSGRGGYRDAAIAVRSELPDGTQQSPLPQGYAALYLVEGLNALTTISDGDVTARRCASPLAGIGVLSSILEQDIFSYQDPSDVDGDGISGRVNFEGGRLGRFGWKAQVSSIERIVRGQLFVHMGLTTAPLGRDVIASLPIPLRSARVGAAMEDLGEARAPQFIDPDLAVYDGDPIRDPEVDTPNLFNLVAWTVLQAAPRPDEPTDQTRAGAVAFRTIGCESCHRPSLQTPAGTVAVYSDFLLHDMGADRGDGITEGLASRTEFRTAPLWTAGLGGPYLHDCAADTVAQAITLHGGEAETAREAYLALSSEDRDAVDAFVRSLGGAADYASFLERRAPEEGWGAARAELPTGEADAYQRGFFAFTQWWSRDQGLGPEVSGESCADCHGIPDVGGGGRRQALTYLQGSVVDGEFVAPPSGPRIPRFRFGQDLVRPDREARFVVRQSPPTLTGIGLFEAVDTAALSALDDENDLDGDGVSGRLADLGVGAGIFGRKAQWPDLRAAVAGCATRYMGLTIDDASPDADAASDPEMTASVLDDLTTFVRFVSTGRPTTVPTEGLEQFQAAGCADCHQPTLPGAAGGEVVTFSDLLLHDVLDAGGFDVPDGDAHWRELRTPTLIGIDRTAPYMRNAGAGTLEAAIGAHSGEAAGSAERFHGLSSADREILLAFLRAL